MTSAITPDSSRLQQLLAEDPVLSAVRAAAGDLPVWLVGGAIRDALCGYPVDDIDLVIEGDPVSLVRRLDPEALVHDRFGTAGLLIGDRPVDIARARTETYSRPGALPDVSPGSIEDDLSRRDFSINAIACSLNGSDPGATLDPYRGLADLADGVLRVLHPRSFIDDPTRALRAARYAARFGFDLTPATAELLSGVDFTTISRDRFDTEIELISREPRALEAVRLLSVWGLIKLEGDRLDLARRALALSETETWADTATADEVIRGACFGDPAKLADLSAEPESPAEGIERAARFSSLDLLLARAGGAEWLDRWRTDWRWVELEITGADLLAAGIPEGPALGAGMKAARRARLNDGVAGVGPELRVALDAARESLAAGTDRRR